MARATSERNRKTVVRYFVNRAPDWFYLSARYRLTRVVPDKGPLDGCVTVCVGGEAARSCAGRRRQVPRPQEVPAAAHHLGRRGDVVLLQGAVAYDAARVVRAQLVPVAARQAPAGRGDRPDDHSGQQLVQEPTTAGPRQRLQGQVGAAISLRRR